MSETTITVLLMEELVEVVATYDFTPGEPGNIDGSHDDAREPQADQVDVTKLEYNEFDISWMIELGDNKRLLEDMVLEEIYSERERDNAEEQSTRKRRRPGDMFAQ